MSPFRCRWMILNVPWQLFYQNGVSSLLVVSCQRKGREESMLLFFTLFIFKAIFQLIFIILVGCFAGRADEYKILLFLMKTNRK